MKSVFCPYCGSQAEFKDAFAIYRRMGFGMIYQCPTTACDAYVGVHEGTDKPKGSLANARLRGLRKQVHAVFDPLWQDSREYDRAELYEAASHVLGLKEFHVGEMRDEAAMDFLAAKDELLSQIKLAAQRNRLLKISKSDCNLINVLRNLYVNSQRGPRHALAHSAYRGHLTLFKAGIDAGLVKRIKKASTEKVYFVLTPSGCAALGLPVR